MEFRGVVGSQRRITIPRIYAIEYGFSEGELVEVSLSDSAIPEESGFLAHIQKGFRVQIPQVEYEKMELSQGSTLDVEIEPVKKEKTTE